MPSEIACAKSGNTASPGRQPECSRELAPALVSALLAAIVFVTVAAYSPVLFDFFAGDDFVHLVWLKDAVRNPELIWRNFHSSWLDGTTARFYRPLISLFMVSDYMIWGPHGLGFHITNLACHLTSSVFLYAVVAGLCSDWQGRRCGQRWALYSAALFALYPLHTEAVSWITGRVDAIVTMFVLAAFWAFQQHRRGKSPFWLALALALNAAALMSKEMAVTMPVVFVLYDLFFPRVAGASLPARILGAARRTCPFWLLLGLYFVVRRIALGTFVGGYDDSLFFVSNLSSFAYGWLHGLRMLIVPLNKAIMGAHDPLTRIWEVLLVSVALLSAAGIRQNRSLVRPLAFMLLWLAMSLIPVYKIFVIADDLQGSRLAYLATAPLCVLLASAAACDWKLRAMRPAALAIMLATIAACAAGLYRNNEAWAAAGRESNAVRSALARLYSRIEGDPQVLFVGLPDNVDGAYVMRNALWGMTKSPQLMRDVINCLMVDRYEPILPFGLIKDSIAACGSRVSIFRWSPELADFVPVAVPPAGTPLARHFASADRFHPLREFLRPVETGNFRYSFLPDGSLAVFGGQGVPGRPAIDLAMDGASCFDINFITLTLAPGKGSDALVPGGADLLYANDLHGELDLFGRVHAESADPEGRLVFALRGLPEWSLGGKVKKLRLLLPPGCRLILKEAAVNDRRLVLPSLSFAGSGYLGSKGFIHLSQTEKSCAIDYDAGGGSEVASAELVITRPNLQFAQQNAVKETAVAGLRLRLPGRKGKFTLERGLFPSPGSYQIRIWALDASGKPIGVASDHAVVSVDS